MTPTENADRLRRLLEILDRLVVTMNGDDPDFLLVDAADVMATANDVRYWSLRYEGDGVWSHGPSGELAPLGKALRSIARVYLDKPQSLVDIPGSPASEPAEDSPS